jgi:hypothetical protein
MPPRCKPRSPRAQWQLKQFLYAEVLRELDEHFAAMKVRYMPIKGAYLILSGLAEKIPARKMVDIDILVEKENFSKAVDYFARCPRARLHHDEWYFEQPFYYSFAGGEVHVELHFLLNRPERFKLETERLFAEGERKGEWLWLPSAEWAMVITVCHALVHIAYYLDQSVFDDIRVMSAVPALRWERFWPLAASTGIRPFFYFLFSLADVGAPVVERGRRKEELLAAMLVVLYRNGLYHRLPSRLRRLFCELPFARKPLRLCTARRRG